MSHENKLFFTAILSAFLFGIFILVAIQEGVADIVGFLFRDYFTATLAFSILLLNVWMSWLNYHEGVDYLEGYWEVNLLVDRWRGEESSNRRGTGEMYLVRTSSKNSFHGYLRLNYIDRDGNSEFVAVYSTKFNLKMKNRLSSIGDVKGQTIMVCRMPVEKHGHDSFVKDHTQTLVFDKRKCSLIGETRIEGQDVFGRFEAIKQSP